MASDLIPLPTNTDPESAGTPADKPLVSVLIRSMDRASLSEALACVAAQTYPTIEVVLVNAKGMGHSDVGPWCGRFPVRMVGGGNRLDRSAAANMGLEQAQGAYLLFLDDDDLIDPEHIESLVSSLTQSPGYRAAYSGTRVIDATGATLGVYDHAFSSAQLLVGNFLPIHAVLFSKELVEAGCHFDATLTTYEDWDFWLQIARHTGFVQTGKVSASYRSFLGDSGMSQAEHRPLQRQRRSVVWRKWWSSWQVENVELLATELEDAQVDRDQRITALGSELNREVATNIRLSNDLTTAHATLSLLSEQVSNLNLTIDELHTTLAARESVLANREAQISHLHARIHDILSSTSWKLTAPVRLFARLARAAQRKFGALRVLVRSTWQFLRRDALGQQVRRGYRFVQLEGWSGVKRLLARKASGASDAPHKNPLPGPSTELVASGMAVPERRNIQALSSIDVDRYTYFFFDVFDTTIIRLFEKPVDVFKHIEWATHCAGFAESRVLRERKAREAHRTRKDIRLPDIYQGFPGSSLTLEIDSELSFCVAHPQVLDFYQGLIAKKKKIFFVSDMYLSKETVTAILRKNGFTVFEDVFVSSEDDLIKGDGSRFTWLQATLPDSVGTAIHIGDNHVSDWVQPRSHGYDALQFQESIEFYAHDPFLFSKARCLIDHNSLGISFILGMFKYWKSGFLSQTPGYWKQFGFFYGGALVCAFCDFVNTQVSQAKLSASRIFFLARDGDIMSKVYRMLHSEYEATYLLASRRCMSFPSLHTVNALEDQDALKLFTTPIGVASAQDLMDRFGYDDLEGLSQSFRDLESNGLLHSESDILQCIVRNGDSVLAKAASERDTLLHYLDFEHFFDSSDIVIADVGWGGSIQNALMNLLQRSGKGDRSLHGIYLGVGDRVAHEKFKTGYLFQGDKSRFGDFLNLIELITSSPMNGVTRIAKNGDQFGAVSAQPHDDELNRQSIAADIQAGILDFAQIIKGRGIKDLSFFQPRDFEALFTALQEHPSQEDVEQLSGVKHAMTLGNHFGDSVLNRKG